MDVPALPWLHPSVVVRQSQIEGDGLFAVDDIHVGVTVARFGGHVVTNDELDRIIASSEAYIDTLSLDGDLNLVMPGRTPNGYGNHSCDPNVWWCDELRLEARRLIRAGDEVALDYATITDDPTFSMECRCGSQPCRQHVTGTDWRDRELQRSYENHWIPGLRRKIAGA